MEKFSKLYVKKCIKGRSEIGYFRSFEKWESEKIPLASYPFKEGDYFYHPEMEEDEVKVVEEMDENFLYISNRKESFLEEECTWVPTAKQIKDGLETIHWFTDTEGLNEEQLLDKYMREHERKEWDFDKQDWIEI